MRYQIKQSTVNVDSWYVDDTEQNKTVAIFLKPYDKVYAQEYADFKNGLLGGAFVNEQDVPEAEGQDGNSQAAKPD